MRLSCRRAAGCRNARCGSQNGASHAHASGKKYKECCWQRLQGFDVGKAYDQAIKDNNPERALIATRADITQHTIWHKTNTVPALSRLSVGLELLSIDVNALGAYVSRLPWLYYRLGLALHINEARLYCNLIRSYITFSSENTND